MVFKEKNKRIIFLIFVLVIAIRLINITMPILEGTATRQIQTAMIARNFYTGGFNILYPQIDFLGPGPGYLILEFPLLNFIIALLYKIIGGVYEWAGRLIIISFFAGTCIFLYKIVRRLFNERIAIISLLAFSLSPLSIIYSRTLMPDFTMLFFSMGAIFFMLKYSEGENSRNFWVSCIFCMFSLLTKPHSLYIAIPLAFLLWHRDRRFIIKPSAWLYLIIVLLPTLLWILHGKAVHTVVSREELYNFQLSNWFNPHLLISTLYYKKIWTIIVDWALTPIGFTLFFIGVFIRLNKPIQRVLWFWMFGVGIYYVMFNTHIINQPHYHLILVPVTSIFIGLSCERIFSKDFILKSHLSNRFVLTIAILLCVATILRFGLFAYIVPRGYRHIPALAKKIEEMTDKDDLLVTTIPDGHSTLYYSKRKGWSFLLPGDDPEKTKEAIARLEELRGKGAKYFVSVCEDFLDQSPDFEHFLRYRYKIVREKPGLYSIYSLD